MTIVFDLMSSGRFIIFEIKTDSARARLSDSLGLV